MASGRQRPPDWGAIDHAQVPPDLPRWPAHVPARARGLDRPSEPAQAPPAAGRCTRIGSRAGGSQVDAQEALALVLTGAMLTRAGYASRSRSSGTGGSRTRPYPPESTDPGSRPDASEGEST